MNRIYLSRYICSLSIDYFGGDPMIGWPSAFERWCWFAIQARPKISGAGPRALVLKLPDSLPFFVVFCTPCTAVPRCRCHPPLDWPRKRPRRHTVPRLLLLQHINHASGAFSKRSGRSYRGRLACYNHVGASPAPAAGEARAAAQGSAPTTSTPCGAPPTPSPTPRATTESPHHPRRGTSRQATQVGPARGAAACAAARHVGGACRAAASCEARAVGAAAVCTPSRTCTATACCAAAVGGCAGSETAAWRAWGAAPPSAATSSTSSTASCTSTRSWQ